MDDMYLISEERYDETKRWLKNWPKWVEIAEHSYDPSTPVIERVDSGYGYPDPTGERAISKEAAEVNCNLVDSALKLAQTRERIAVLRWAVYDTKYSELVEKFHLRESMDDFLQECRKFMFYMSRICP